MGQVLTFRTTRAPPSSCSRSGAISASTAHHGVGPLKLGHVAWVVDVAATGRGFLRTRCLGFKVSDWIEDWFVFMRCNADHHTVNFIRGAKRKMHHMAFELKDFIHMQNACDLFGQRNIPIIWGPVRHGPGHNIAIYHRTPDDQLIELFCELDRIARRGARLFRAAPLASRHAAAAEDLGNRPSHHYLGAAAAAGLSPRRTGFAWPGKLRGIAHEAIAGAAAAIPRVSSGCSPYSHSTPAMWSAGVRAPSIMLRNSLATPPA